MHVKDHAGTSEVVVRCREDNATRVRLFDPVGQGDDELAFGIEVRAAGLSARLENVEVHAWQTEYLSTFLARCAADFRGWDGERVWHTNHLTLSATFRAGGHVQLVWTLYQRLGAPASWQVSATTWLEAGEQLTQLAEQAGEFLRGW